VLLIRRVCLVYVCVLLFCNLISFLPPASRWGIRNIASAWAWASVSVSLPLLSALMMRCACFNGCWRTFLGLFPAFLTRFDLILCDSMRCDSIQYRYDTIRLAAAHTRWNLWFILAFSDDDVWRRTIGLVDRHRTQVHRLVYCVRVTKMALHTAARERYQAQLATTFPFWLTFHHKGCGYARQPEQQDSAVLPLSPALSLSLFWRASSSAATALLAPFRVDTHGHTHTNETLGFGSRKASARLHRLTTSEPSGVPVKLFITVLAAHIPLVVVFFALGCQASPLFT